MNRGEGRATPKERGMLCGTKACVQAEAVTATATAIDENFMVVWIALIYYYGVKDPMGSQKAKQNGMML